jgi:hypothetical protein
MQIPPCNSSKGAQDYNEKRWSAPRSEENESDESVRKIARRSYGTDPQCIVERRTEQSNDSRVDSAHDGLRADPLVKGVREWQRTLEDDYVGTGAAPADHRSHIPTTYPCRACSKIPDWLKDVLEIVS